MSIIFSESRNNAYCCNLNNKRLKILHKRSRTITLKMLTKRHYVSLSSSEKTTVKTVLDCVDYVKQCLYM